MGSCVGGHVHAFLVDEMKIEIAAKLPYMSRHRGKPVKVGSRVFGSMSEAGRYFGVKQTTVSARKRKGWSLEQIFELESRSDICNGVVYVIYNVVNGKKYFGLTTDFACRIRHHRHAVRTGQPGKLYDAIREFGGNAFRIRVVARTESRRKLRNLEKHFIAKFNTITNGYNVMDGGGWAGNGESKRIEVGGRIFDNEHEVAKYLGVDSRTVYRRRRLGLPMTHGAWSPKNHTVVSDGMEFDSIGAAAEHFGLTYSTCKYRLRNGLSLALPHHFTRAS